MTSVEVPLTHLSKKFDNLSNFCFVDAGFYETRIAYYAWRGANGYRFASIPDY